MNSADTAAHRWSWPGTASDADLPALLGREWLETNGLGGFASGSVAGANMRRLHSLLLAATSQPVGRFALVSKLLVSYFANN